MGKKRQKTIYVIEEEYKSSSPEERRKILEKLFLRIIKETEKL